MVFGVSLAMAGCGGESPPPKVDAAPVASSAPVTKSDKAGPKGKNALAPGETESAGAEGAQAKRKTSGRAVTHLA